MYPCPVIRDELARRLHPWLFDPMRDFERKRGLAAARGMWRDIAAVMLSEADPGLPDEALAAALRGRLPDDEARLGVAAFSMEFLGFRPPSGAPRQGTPSFGSA
jgi:hypothetical protein